MDYFIKGNMARSKGLVIRISHLLFYALLLGLKGYKSYKLSANIGVYKGQVLRVVRVRG